MRTKQNYGGLDRFRIAAALLVIAIHTSPLASVNEGADFFLTRVLARVAVPFFFMVTGQFVVGGFLSSSGGARFRRFLAKTGLLYVFCILLYLPIGIYAGHYEDMTVGSALRMLVFDGTFYHLWYFPACLLGIGLVYLMSRALSLRGMTAVSAALYVIGLFGDSYYGLAQKVPALEAAYEFGFGIFSYTRNGLFLAPLFLVMGAWMSTADKRTKASRSSLAQADRQKLLFLGLSAAVSFALMTAEAFLLRHFQLQRHDSMYLALIPTMFFLYRCLLCLPQKSSGYLRNASTWIYVLHPAFIVVVRGIAKPLHLTELLVDNSVLHYLAVALLSVAASLLAAYVQMRWLSPILASRRPQGRKAAARPGKRRRPGPKDTWEDGYEPDNGMDRYEDYQATDADGYDAYGGYAQTDTDEYGSPLGGMDFHAYDGMAADGDDGTYDQLLADEGDGMYDAVLVNGEEAAYDEMTASGRHSMYDDWTGNGDDGMYEASMADGPNDIYDRPMADGAEGGSQAVGQSSGRYTVLSAEMRSNPPAGSRAAEGYRQPGTETAGLQSSDEINAAYGEGSDVDTDLPGRVPGMGAPTSSLVSDRTASLRAWIEVDSDALALNVNFLRSRIPEHCRLMPAVKAQAYGHGAVIVSRELNRLGVDAFCVATIWEGIELRRADVEGTILILGYTPPKDFRLLSKYQLTQTVIDFHYAQLLNQAGPGTAVHIGIDTGMHRVGIRCEAIDEIRAVYDMPNLKVEGLFTHLCASDSPLPEHKAFTDSQIKAFYQVIDILKGEGYPCPGLHLLASYGCLNLLPDRAPSAGNAQRFADRRSAYNVLRLAADYVRPGIVLYGILSTDAETQSWKDSLKPVLSLKAKVVSVRPLYAGESVGYGITYTASQDMRIAAVSIGYADGLPRALSCGKGSVLIDGRKAPVIGRICMDQTIVDVSSIPDVKEGDTAVIIGRSGDQELTVGQIADQCGTIAHEILTCLSERLDRILI